MIITKKAIPRRTILRGLGTALALPLLDSMVPALTALQKTAGAPIKRFGVVYTPNGMVMRSWTPEAEGAGFDFPATLKPLEPYRDRITVLTGLSSKPPANSPVGAAAGVHARASTRFMTACHPQARAGLRDLGRHVDRPDCGGRIREADAAWLARACPRGQGLRRIVRRGIQLRLHQHDLVADALRRRCRWRTTLARCSSGCSVTAR